MNAIKNTELFKMFPKRNDIGDNVIRLGSAHIASPVTAEHRVIPSDDGFVTVTLYAGWDGNGLAVDIYAVIKGYRARRHGSIGKMEAERMAGELCKVSRLAGLPGILNWSGTWAQGDNYLHFSMDGPTAMRKVKKVLG